jgi:tetratricopeptide (TPR) repeat protein
VLQEFTTRVPGQVNALLKLVEICVDGGLEATMYETQAQLADAYLERGAGAEARVIAEDLVAREPWEHAHIDRFRRALVLLNVPDPDALIADRLSGQGPFVATDPFMAAESFGDDPVMPILQPFGSEPQAPVGEPESPVQPEPEPERDPEPADPPVDEPPPAAPPRQDPPPQAPPRNEPDIPLRAKGGLDIDLTSVLSQLQGGGASLEHAPPAAAPQDLQDIFDTRRTQMSREAGMQEAAEQLALAHTYLDMGMNDEAIAALSKASRVPAHRFAAASLLGRLYLKKNDPAKAVEWLERAAQAPAPTADEGRELLYDLGATLESTGETARALAVFLELQADAGDYRDVAARVDHLARVQTGG